MLCCAGLKLGRLRMRCCSINIGITHSGADIERQPVDTDYTSVRNDLTYVDVETHRLVCAEHPDIPHRPLDGNAVLVQHIE